MTEEKRKLDLTEEERQRRSEQASAMHEVVVVDPETDVERRKFGGAQPGSGPKKRVGSSVKEYAEEHMHDIVAALARGLSNPSADVARRSAESFLKHARQEEQDEIAERRDELEQHQRDAIMGRILQRLEGRPGAGDVVLDAEYSEVEDAELVGDGVEHRALPPSSD